MSDAFDVWQQKKKTHPTLTCLLLYTGQGQAARGAGASRGHQAPEAEEDQVRHHLSQPGENPVQR